MNLTTATNATRILLLLCIVLGQIGSTLAQDGKASSSPEGMAMLVLFLGIAGIIGVFVIRWSQTTSEDED